MGIFNSTLNDSLAGSPRGDATDGASCRRRPSRCETDAEQLAADLVALVRCGLVDLHHDGDNELRAEVRDRG